MNAKFCLDTKVNIVITHSKCKSPNRSSFHNSDQHFIIHQVFCQNNSKSRRFSKSNCLFSQDVMLKEKRNLRKKMMCNFSQIQHTFKLVIYCKIKNTIRKISSKPNAKRKILLKYENSLTEFNF